MKTLSEFKEQISDDFQSTFTVINDYMLANMMGFPNDFKQVEQIIKKYIPEAIVSFKKTNELGKDSVYDIYLISIIKSNE